MAKRNKDEIYDVYIKIINDLHNSKVKEVYCGALISLFLMRAKHAVLPCGSMPKEKQDMNGLHNVTTLIFNDKPIDVYVSRSLKIDEQKIMSNKGKVLFDLQFDPVELI